MTSLYAMVEQPDLESPGAGRGARRAGSTPASAPTAPPTSARAARPPHGRPLRRRRAARPARPPARRCASSTASTPQLTWPEIELRAGPRTRAATTCCCSSAPSPTTRGGRSRSRSSTSPSTSARAWWSGLGAYPAPVPHTRPPLLAAAASSEELAPGLLQNTVDVPAGVQGDDRAPGRAAAASPALGLWAQVPHYVVGHAVPGGVARAARGRQPRSPGSTCPIADLAEQADASRRRIDELVAQNPEHVAMLEQLEAQADARRPPAPSCPATSGDELAAELERFLREQGSN